MHGTVRNYLTATFNVDPAMIRILPNVPHGIQHNPWTRADRPYITVPAADIFKVNGTIRIPVIRRANNFVLDLWEILKAHSFLKMIFCLPPKSSAYAINAIMTGNVRNKKVRMYGQGPSNSSKILGKGVLPKDIIHLSLNCN